MTDFITQAIADADTASKRTQRVGVEMHTSRAQTYALISIAQSLARLVELKEIELGDKAKKGGVFR